MSSKVDLKLDWCSYAAAKYAVEKWHYSRRMPKSKIVRIGVWEKGQFLGCLIYGVGATEKLVSPYGLSKWEGCELCRVALRSHDAPVTRIMAVSLRMLKKLSPGLRLVVSFADPNENHSGVIYQAGNWLYTGKSAGCNFYQDKAGKQVRPSDCRPVFKEGKHRYLMPLDKEMREQIEKLRKPYPKRVGSADSGTVDFQSAGGGASPSSTLSS